MAQLEIRPSGLNYWEYILYLVDLAYDVRKNIVIKGGQTLELCSFFGRGCWAAFAFTCNNKNLIYGWELDGMSWEGDIQGAYNTGLTQPNNYFCYVTEYDDVNSLYGLAWAPSFPAIYTRKLRVYLKNPTSSDIIVYYCENVWGSVMEELVPQITKVNKGYDPFA